MPWLGSLEMTAAIGLPPNARTLHFSGQDRSVLQARQIANVARDLRIFARMTHPNSHRAGTDRTLPRLAEMSAALVACPVLRPLRHTTVAPRTGLLRLAPRLSVLPGNRKRPSWPAIARGMRAAVTRVTNPSIGDAEDGPQCA
jgi:hypothetical protein